MLDPVLQHEYFGQSFSKIWLEDMVRDLDPENPAPNIAGLSHFPAMYIQEEFPQEPANLIDALRLSPELRAEWYVKQHDALAGQAYDQLVKLFEAEIDVSGFASALAAFYGASGDANHKRLAARSEKLADAAKKRLTTSLLRFDEIHDEQQEGEEKPFDRIVAEKTDAKKAAYLQKLAAGMPNVFDRYDIAVNDLARGYVYLSRTHVTMAGLTAACTILRLEERPYVFGDKDHREAHDTLKTDLRDIGTALAAVKQIDPQNAVEDNEKLAPLPAANKMN